MCGFIIAETKKIDSQLVENSFNEIKYRGPDHSTFFWVSDSIFIGFHRLAIMDLSTSGQQPFELEDKLLVCNGEIYNHKVIRTDFEESGILKSQSDCEIILPLIKEVGLAKACNVLDGEFAFAYIDKKTDLIMAARDPIGIRPLFYGISKSSKKFVFASEVKALQSFCDDIKPFPPGHYYDGSKFISYCDLTSIKNFHPGDLDDALSGIRQHLIDAVGKRLESDAPLGFLLSGGLDSSLVCAIATKMFKKKITTFAVGIEENPIDTKYAKKVADDLGCNHHEVLFKKDDIFRTLDDLIYRLESYDITTIRASMGMNLVCEYVRDKTDIKVLLTGEVSDELFGYKYTDYAPGPVEFQKESKKRVDELYIYDVLRADRCISSNSLEARVPFSDKSFVKYVMEIAPEIKMNSYGIGKYLLRKAFEKDDLLTEEILYRQKAAFSDAQGHAVVDYLKAHAEEIYCDSDLAKAQERYLHATPKSKEALMYRDIFERHFSNKSYLIKDFWLPNKDWENCDVEDPSARVLPNYGKSGE